ncbi:VaFE repeat-containing surface-anchored protein, partial [Corynebacterium sp. MSK105]|uniref:VaFE repeat-containing surface-anchored protein n=1 Tax=Corynebacterium sp. MSK105 TaxID=3050204 RepID=UPI00254C1249
MSKLRNISREGWMVFTAVLAAIAVIAAMVHVPGAEAQDGDERFSVEANKGLPQVTTADAPNWGTMVWTGKPDGSEGKMNVGWAWCIDPILRQPIDAKKTYDRNNAGKAPIEPEYRDAAINVATKMHNAILQGEKQTVANYSVYLAALIGSNVDNGQYVGGARNDTREHILNPTHSSDGAAGALWKNYNGSAKEFTQLTGFIIKQDPNRSGRFILERDPSVSIPKAPEGAYITIVGPQGNLTSDHGSLKGNQRVFTPDQPGLPGDGGDGSNPSGREPSIKTEAKFAEGSSRVVNGAVVTDTVTYEGLVVGKKYHLDAKLMSKDGKTVLG